jgi:hypothetical protein
MRITQVAVEKFARAERVRPDTVPVDQPEGRWHAKLDGRQARACRLLPL